LWVFSKSFYGFFDFKDVKLNPNELRRQGWIPTVLYGHGEPKPGVVAEKSFLAAMHNKAGRNALFTIKIGSENTLGIIKEIQRHITSHKPIHIDFQRINEKEKIEVNVSVHVIGEAPGVKNSGGILELIQREIRINCLPNDIPTSIDVDVSKLELGHGVKV
jgi:large subunit ribosomal protein L25